MSGNWANYHKQVKVNSSFPQPTFNVEQSKIEAAERREAREAKVNSGKKLRGNARRRTLPRNYRS